MTAYLGYSEGSRAATSIELGCADPEQPCKLPNAMAGDPPLEQVVTRTLDAGLRGEYHGFNWSTGVFRAANHDDILFVTSDQTGFGYFRNFGETRRQGIELALDRRIGKLTIGAGYTYLNATFQSEETVNGEGNSSNDAAGDGEPGLEGLIEIEPGDRIPLIPAHTFKAYGDIQITSALAIDVNLIAASSLYARGNENNRHEPDGDYYLGPGTAGGYAIVNLGATYQLTKWLQLVARINNLFDNEYSTAAQLGPMGFTGDGSFIARPFPPSNGEFPLRHSTFYGPVHHYVHGSGRGSRSSSSFLLTTESAEQAERWTTALLAAAHVYCGRPWRTPHSTRLSALNESREEREESLMVHAACGFRETHDHRIKHGCSWDDICAAGTARSAVGPPRGGRRESADGTLSAFVSTTRSAILTPALAGVPAGVSTQGLESLGLRFSVLIALSSSLQVLKKPEPSVSSALSVVNIGLR